MQSTYHFIFSGCTGVTLVLASGVMMAPLLAVLVAAACVSAAWVLLRLDVGRAMCRPEERDGLRDHRESTAEGVEP